MSKGFTLIEVLVAMAITALVALVAYASLSAVISGVEGARQAAEKMHSVNRVFSMLGRDLRQVVNRPVVNDFGYVSPALIGGRLADDWLTLTRAGWHNSTGAFRSTLQRVGWRVEDRRLIRFYYPVLDRIPVTPPIETELLGDVDRFDILFLPAINLIKSDRNGVIDRRNWQENWIEDFSQPNYELSPPAAVEIAIEIQDFGEIRRTYVLPGA